MTMSVAIITGASSGLGKEYVDAVVEQFPQIHELWIISRHEDALQTVADRYPQREFKLIPLDLNSDADLQKFADTISKFNPDVKLLINDAGFINSEAFAKQDYDKQRMMIGVNVIAPTLITRIVLKYMKPSSLIVNVCSTSAFAPVQGQSIYSSTKAYVYSLSLSLHWELKKLGIKLLVMCPGNMKTNMYQYNALNATNKSTQAIGYLPFLDLHVITRKSLSLVQKGHIVYTPGLFYKTYRGVTKVLPHTILSRFLKG